MAFLEAFEQLGWTDGRNVRIMVRWGGGNESETRKYAEEIVALAPDVILTAGVGAELILKATRTIPVVFANVPDPMGSGYKAARVTAIDDVRIWAWRHTET
jgi:putative ABC transport system substrate-binding protein